MFKIGDRKIGKNYPTYIIAELSCNHHGRLEEALRLVKAAKESGADAFKIQTYTGDTITLNCNKKYFKLKNTSWDEKGNLWELFNMAHTPWGWQYKIQQEVNRLGMDFFSSPFDHTAVDFLEGLNVPAYKVASAEIIDIPLLKKIAKTKKPVIMSTGMASLSEIEEGVKTLKENGTPCVALLKCTSAYPSKPEDANLLTIPHLSETFKCVTGLSDHTLGIGVPVTAVALGANIIEKHFTMSRSDGGPDSTFSLEPHEFKQMVDTVRVAEKALGKIHYGGVKSEVKIFRRSLFAIKNIKKGEKFIENENIRSIRPGDGLHSRHLYDFVGKTSSKDVERGTPISWDMLYSESSKNNPAQHYAY